MRLLEVIILLYVTGENMTTMEAGNMTDDGEDSTDTEGSGSIAGYGGKGKGRGGGSTPGGA
jgi:hypothetical protein